jgi:hypothetical protein
MFRARGYQSWKRLAEEGRLRPATGQFWGSKPSEELYDLVDDPDNVKNLAADVAHRSTLERMRAALRQRTLEINDNGFMPEGSAIEGYEASRAKGAYPLERLFELATLASERNPAHLPAFIAALGDKQEAVRWWAAQGCTILGEQAAPAEALLRARLEDKSGAVQVAAAEALARQGKQDLALPVLQRCLADTNNLAFALQAANVLDRLGEQARPALPTIQETLKGLGALKGERYEGYLQRILGHAVGELQKNAPSEH